jgi:chemotaxis protein methyltransferase WspC
VTPDINLKNPPVTTQFEKILNKHIGLDAETVGQATIERAVRKRMRSCDVEDLKTYAIQLEKSNDELIALIDEVVIPETWFFRDGVPFDALADYARTWGVPNYTGPLRALSIPCSTGEEAYSIAIVLCEAGLGGEAAYIDAVDISPRSLESARRAVYGPHSFRGTGDAFRDRYFTHKDGHYTLMEPVRQMVRFHCGNLLEPKTLPSREAYDVIFCRNLLIYFNRPTQQRAANILMDLMTENGLLFVGHAEAGQFLETGLVPLPRRGSFAYRKPLVEQRASDRTGADKTAGSARCTTKPKQRPKVVVKPSWATASTSPAVVGHGGESTTALDKLKVVRELADQGQVKQAMEVCETMLNESNASAGAYYLMGILCESVGDEKRAEQMFHKTVYLDPNHEEALVHLSLHAERVGNPDAAASYRRRVKRISERGNAVKETESR